MPQLETSDQFKAALKRYDKGLGKEAKYDEAKTTLMNLYNANTGASIDYAANKDKIDAVLKLFATAPHKNFIESEAPGTKKPIVDFISEVSKTATLAANPPPLTPPSPPAPPTASKPAAITPPADKPLSPDVGRKSVEEQADQKAPQAVKKQKSSSDHKVAYLGAGAESVNKNGVTAKFKRAIETAGLDLSDGNVLTKDDFEKIKATGAEVKLRKNDKGQNVERVNIDEALASVKQFIADHGKKKSESSKEVKPVEESRSAEKSSFFDRALQTLKTPPSKWDFGKGKKEEAVEAKDVKGKQSEGKESKKAVNFHSPGY